MRYAWTLGLPLGMKTRPCGVAVPGNAGRGTVPRWFVWFRAACPTVLSQLTQSHIALPLSVLLIICFLEARHSLNCFFLTLFPPRIKQKQMNTQHHFSLSENRCSSPLPAGPCRGTERLVLEPLAERGLVGCILWLTTCFGGGAALQSSSVSRFGALSGSV